ncbi:MAG: serine/threonine protein kinase [Kofleriaceae bacterium]
MQELSFGKYTVIRRLGLGGMAEVYLCRLQGMGGFEKQVVVKRIRADVLNDYEFITMFLDEARLAANLNHSNIVQIFEADQFEGMPYIAMEYINGPTLSALLRRVRDRPIEYGHFALIFANVAAGLDHAHSAVDTKGAPLQIVHRDVSPHNIILSTDGVPKIFDFGIAKARGSLAVTGSRTIKGKFAYMAPEQLRSHPVDGKADVYALGVCLYEACTGRRPFAADSEGELFALRLDGKFDKPSQWHSDFPAELEAIILGAMHPDPEVRPTALELHNRLLAFAEAGPYASTTRAIARWLKELYPTGTGDDRAEMYDSYSSSPSRTITPMPITSSNHALVAAKTQASTVSRGKLIAAVATAFVGVTAAAIYFAQPSVPASPANDRDRLTAASDSPPRAGTASPTTELVAAAVPPAPEPLDHEPTPVTIIRHPSRPAAAAARNAPVRATGSVSVKTDAGASIFIDDELVGRGSIARRATAVGRHIVEVRQDSRTVRRTIQVRAGSDNVLDLMLPKQIVVAQRAPEISSESAAPPSQPEPPPARDGSGSGSGSSAPVAAKPSPPTPAQRAQPAVTSPGTLDAIPSIGGVSVIGSLRNSDVQNGLARIVDDLRSCYQQAAQRAQKTPALRVRISFEIDEARASRNVSVSGDTLGIAACARDSASKIRTRVAPDVGTAKVSVVVKFQPTKR